MQEEVTVNFRGEEITLRVPQGTTDEQIRGYLEKQSAPQPRETSTAGTAAAYGLSAVNSALFGVPEMAARQFGAGPRIEQMRQDYPVATTAGDITGMAVPGVAGIKLAGAAVRGIGGRMGGEAVETAGQTAVTRAVDANKSLYTDAISRLDTRQAMARVNPTPQNVQAAEQAQKHFNKVTKELDAIERMARKEAAGGILGKTARVGAQTTGGIMGLQLGGGALGAARTQESPGAGFQQGAQTVGQAVQQFNPLQVIPGVPQVTQGVTQIVPGAAGYGSMLYNTLIDQQIRDEAARRALQGQR
jgi:hypothetical protein